MKCQVAAIQWGGVVAEIFRGKFSVVSGSRRDSVGGGGSSRNFRSSPEAVEIQWGGG